MFHDSLPIVSRGLSFLSAMFHVVSFYSVRAVHQLALPQESNATLDEDDDFNDHAADRAEEDE